ncbi:hypothetical protein ACFX15_031179 [Malus domestica]
MLIYVSSLVTIESPCGCLLIVHHLLPLSESIGAHLTKVVVGGHDFQSSNSSVSTPSEAQTEISSGCDFSSEHASEAEDLEDLTTTDEPLFWPFERKTDRNSKATWNYFSMSPRKGMSSKIMKLKQKYKETENGKFHVSEPVGVVNDRIEEDFASKEVPIEMFLGLTEFDGHEGVDSEFNEDDFSLHVSLC